MSKRLVLSVVLVSVIFGTLIGYTRAIPSDFSSDSEQQTADMFEYGYRCDDGSEFTVIASENMSTIEIVPATSADYLKRTTLRLGNQGAYSGGGVIFLPGDVEAELSTDSTAPTRCRSMRPQQESLFYLGD